MSFEAHEIEMEMSEAQAWEQLERSAIVFSEPGALQAELKLHPEFGPKHDRLTKTLLNLVVEGFDITDRPDDATIDKMGETFNELHVLSNEHLIHEIGKVGMALQFLPMGQIITSINEDLSEIKGMTPEIATEIQGAVDGGAAVAKLDPRVAKIVTAGIAAAGGQIAFGKLQSEVVAMLPEVFKENPVTLFAAQITGAMSKALIDRANTPAMRNATVSAVIETVIAAKMAVNVSTVAYWAHDARHVALMVPASLDQAIKRRIDDTADAAEELEAEAQAEAAAQQQLSRLR